MVGNIFATCGTWRSARDILHKPQGLTFCSCCTNRQVSRKSNFAAGQITGGMTERVPNSSAIVRPARRSFCQSVASLREIAE